MTDNRSVSPYLLRRKRSLAEALAARQSPEVQLAEFVACLDRAAVEAGLIADSLEHGTQAGVVKQAADEWRHIQQILSDPEDFLWHDYVRPAQDDLKEVFGE